MSQSEDKGIWANGVVLTFDFVVDNLKVYYSSTAPQGAYKAIKSYLIKNGFEHLKDSDYKNEKIDDLETADLLYHFSVKNKWFPFCLEKLDISPNVIKLDVSADIRAFCDEEWGKEQEEKSRKNSGKKEI